YKCENSGTVSYTDQHCLGGTQVKIDTPPTNAQDAAKRLTEEKKAVKQLERQRHQREAQQEKENKKIEQARLAKQKKCSALALKSKWAEEDLASAKLKTLNKEKLKARRAAEKY